MKRLILNMIIYIYSELKMIVTKKINNICLQFEKNLIYKTKSPKTNRKIFTIYFV